METSDTNITSLVLFTDSSKSASPGVADASPTSVCSADSDEIQWLLVTSVWPGRQRIDPEVSGSNKILNRANFPERNNLSIGRAC